MATVSGLSAQRALELAAEWEAVAQRQTDTDSEVAQLRAQVVAAQEVLAEFANLTVPELQALAQAQATQVSELNDVVVPQIEEQADANSQELIQLRDVSILALEADVESNYQNILDLPHTFSQDVAPEMDDDLDRPLLVGDRWNDTTQTPPQEYRWNGTEWVSANVSVDEFTEAIKEYMSHRHLIY